MWWSHQWLRQCGIRCVEMWASHIAALTALMTGTSLVVHLYWVHTHGLHNSYNLDRARDTNTYMWQLFYYEHTLDYRQLVLKWQFGVWNKERLIFGKKLREQQSFEIIPRDACHCTNVDGYLYWLRYYVHLSENFYAIVLWPTSLRLTGICYVPNALDVAQSPTLRI